MKPDLSIKPRTIILGGLLLVLPASAASAADAANTAPATATANAGTAHTMFMGLDLSVQHEGKNMPVIDVTDEALTVAQDGSVFRVPTEGRTMRLQMKHSLKLSDGAATIESLKAERGYTPAKDPYRKFESASGAASGASADIDLASVGLRGSEMSYSIATGIVNSGAFAPGAASAQAAAAAAIEQSTTDIASASSGAYASENQTSTFAQKLQEELAEENFDALDVEFRVSSPEPLSNPFVVVVAKYRDRDHPNEEARTWIVTKALAPIGPETKKVRFKQGGLPVGYLMDSTQIHLFNNGQEIATTVAPMRTTLTPEEAFQYRVIDYVSTHPDATLPAAPAAGQIAEPLRERLATHYANKPVYVRVLPTGKSERAYVDKECKTPLEDPLLESMLSLVRFDPALNKGKPVRGVVMLVGKPGQA